MSFPLRLTFVPVAGFSVALFVPDADAVKAAYQQGEISFPYWSQVWPAARALADFLAGNPDLIEGKSVVELGAGLGLPSLVAAQKAATVLCTDYVPEAVEAVRQSALDAGLQNIRADVLDWQQAPPGLSADVLLLSDINYEPSAFAGMQNIINTFLQNGATVLLSTPQRLVAKEFVLPLLKFCRRQQELVVQHQGEEVSITVLVLKQ